MNRRVWEATCFDEERYDGFHFYDLDFTRRASEAGARFAVPLDLLLLHRSTGRYGGDWRRYARVFAARSARRRTRRGRPAGCKCGSTRATKSTRCAPRCCTSATVLLRSGAADAFAQIAAAIALPASVVDALPPMSRRARRLRVGEHALDRRRRSALAASAWPRNSSIIAPDQIWPIGFAMPLPAMSGAEPCTGSNSDGCVALGIDVRRRRDADRAAHGGPEVGQDVAEQVGADDDVEELRALHEVRGQDVDVVLVGADVRDSCAPIALKRSSQYGIVIEMPFDLVADVRCFALRVARELERVAQDAVDALAREDGLLEHDLALGALEHAPADRRVLALGVLAHDDEVDVAGLAVGERRRDARHQPARPQVDVLVEAAPELDQRAPQRHVVGHGRRPADRAVVDRLEAATASSNQSSGIMRPCFA